jgi:deoxyribodipyrimidine photolyase-related protein
MSDYCKACVYDRRKRTGEGACPFNFLYWNFMIENESKLARNPRLAMPYRTLGVMAPAEREALRAAASAFFAALGL